MKLRRLPTAVATALTLAAGAAASAAVTLLNVSYDPTREFYQEFNAAFARHWKAKTGEKVTIRQSHGGSGKQARAVIDGLEADVVTLALAYDIDAIAEKAKLLADGLAEAAAATTARPTPRRSCSWCARATRRASRTGTTWSKPGVAVITPNPKTSGGARWNYLAAWGYAQAQVRRRRRKAQASSSRKLFKNVPVLDSGARGSTTTFVERGIGDVLLAWENEAFLARQGTRRGQVRDRRAVAVSILAEPPVARRRQGRRQARARAASPRPTWSTSTRRKARRSRPSTTTARAIRTVAAKYAQQFPKVALFTIDDVFGGWAKAQKTHFADGGVFDQIYKPREVSANDRRMRTSRHVEHAFA